MDYKELTALHLECSCYRVGIERCCKHNGTWIHDTPVILSYELDFLVADLREADRYAALKSRYLAELACAYARECNEWPRMRHFANRLTVDARKALSVISASIRRDHHVASRLRPTVEAIAAISVQTGKILNSSRF